MLNQHTLNNGRVVAVYRPTGLLYQPESEQQKETRVPLAAISPRQQQGPDKRWRIWFFLEKLNLFFFFSTSLAGNTSNWRLNRLYC